MQGIKLQSAMCETNALHSILLLWAQKILGNLGATPYDSQRLFLNLHVEIFFADLENHMIFPGLNPGHLHAGK